MQTSNIIDNEIEFRINYRISNMYTGDMTNKSGLNRTLSHLVYYPMYHDTTQRGYTVGEDLRASWRPPPRCGSTPLLARSRLRSNVQIWPDPYLADIYGFFAHPQKYRELFNNGPVYGLLKLWLSDTIFKISVRRLAEKLLRSAYQLYVNKGTNSTEYSRIETR